MRHFLFLSIFIAASLDAAPLLIRHVTVIDGTGAGPVADRSVLIAHGIIQSVGEGAAPAPTGAVVVNGRGKYLIPGLWDMHTHLWYEQSFFPLYLRFGVTGVRDMGSTLARTRKWQRQVESGLMPGPRVITCGSPIIGKEPRESPMPTIVAATPEAGREAVVQLDRQNVDFIKVLSDLSRDTFLAIADKARSYHIRFAGHLPDSVTALEATEARMRSMEHLFGIALACSSDEYNLRRKRAEALEKHDTAAYYDVFDKMLATYDAEKAKFLFNGFRRLQTWQVPTLVLRQRMDSLNADELFADPALRYVPQSARKGWEDPRVDRDKLTPGMRAVGVKDYEASQKIVRAMQAEGVPLLAGSDTGDAYVVPGSALHDELAELVAAGLTPMQALQTATRNVGTFLLDKKLGTIGAGQYADLVLLDANPLDDIHNTRRISAVVTRGRLYTVKELDRMLLH